MMRPLAYWIALVALMMAATAALGWWTLPILAAVWGGVMATRSHAAVGAAAAGAASWALLLVVTAAQGPVGLLATRVGPVFGLPGWAFLILPLLFAGLVAAASAGLTATIVRHASSRA